MIFNSLPWLFYSLHMLYNSYIVALYVYKILGFDTGYVLFRKHGNYIIKHFLTHDSGNVYKYPELQKAKEKYVFPYYICKDTVYGSVDDRLQKWNIAKYQERNLCKQWTNFLNFIVFHWLKRCGSFYLHCSWDWMSMQYSSTYDSY